MSGSTFNWKQIIGRVNSSRTRRLLAHSAHTPCSERENRQHASLITLSVECQRGRLRRSFPYRDEKVRGVGVCWWHVFLSLQSSYVNDPNRAGDALWIFLSLYYLWHKSQRKWPNNACLRIHLCTKENKRRMFDAYNKIRLVWNLGHAIFFPFRGT